VATRGSCGYYSAKGRIAWPLGRLTTRRNRRLAAGDVVTAAQLELMFGTGSHPITGEPLGVAYKVYDNSGVDGFHVEVACRIESLAKESGRPGRLQPSPAVLARIRSEAARERFISEHDREPANARELSDALRRYSRPRQTAVAGYDRTFSPVKSVSALWAVAPRPMAEAIEAAHDAAGRDALAFIERECCSPARATTAPGRSRPWDSRRPRSFTATPAPADPTCTLGL